MIFICSSHPQLCVQKLRILIEDSDQNCEPSVNACSVSFSHCLRVCVLAPKAQHVEDLETSILNNSKLPSCFSYDSAKEGIMSSTCRGKSSLVWMM